jgi:WD40 repeat protein/peroxiredoxin
LALASDVVRVWDCQSHSFATPELVHPRQVPALAFSATGDRLATGCEDNTARVFALEAQSIGADLLFPPVPHRLLTNWSKSVRPTFIDQDRGLLTAAGPGTVAWWDAATGAKIRSVPSGSSHFMVASPDGRHFAVGDYEETALWDIATGERAGNEMAQPFHVLSGTFSPDGATLISASLDTVRLWSVPDGGRAGPVLKHQGVILQTAVSLDGKVFATAQIDGLVRIWSIALGNHPDQRLPLDGSCTAVKLSGNGRYLIPTGTRSWGANLRSTRVYDASTFQAAGSPLRPGKFLTGADLSPDGRHAVTLNTLGQVHFWDCQTGAPLFDPLTMPSEPRAVRYTPDGRLVIVVCIDGQVLAIDTATRHVARRWQHGRPRGSFRLPSNNFLDVSSDGRRFLSCSMDKLVRVYDITTGKLCCDPLQHESLVTTARFSPDGRLLATAAGGHVRIWEANTSSPTSVLKHPESFLADARFSPDGRYVLTASENGMAQIWDWTTGSLVCPPFQHAKGVTGVGFTPDGGFALTSSRDLTARVWEWHTGKPVTPSLPISGVGHRIVTTPGGSHAVVSGGGSFIDVFSLRDLYARDEMELDDLCTLGEIVSGQRLHEGGDVVNLTTDEWLDRHDRFRERHPEYFRLDWPPEQIIAWHRREADKNLDAEQWYAAVWHLDRLIAQEPENWQHYRDRSRAHLALGHTDAANADQAKASALLPKDTALSLLEGRLQNIAQASLQEQQTTLADLKAHLAAKAESGLGKEDVRWAMTTAESIQRSAGSELAASMYQSFAEVIGKSEYESSAEIAKKMQGIARRLALVGKEMEFQGHRLDGTPFDSSVCQGKVVLVDFWTAWCPYCWPEITNARRNYRLYHDRGFEVVAVNLDQDRQKLDEFLRKDPLPWVVLHTDGAGWNHPLAAHYGISSVPTMFLVGQDGKVVSTQVRGRQLDQLLERLLGPPHIPLGKLSCVDLKGKANKRLGDNNWRETSNDWLGELPQGEQTFGGVKFRIGVGSIHLGSQGIADQPRQVEGIPINTNFTSLYILHCTRCGFVPDGTLIGKYQVKYNDGAEETIPIVYGEDLRDLWDIDHSKPVSRGTVAWEGNNAAAKAQNFTLRLYVSKWTNPRPEKEVATIDYVSTDTVAAPFCVAMTAEWATDTAHTDPVSQSADSASAGKKTPDKTATPLEKE